MLPKEMRVQDKLEYSINIIGNLGEFFRSAKPEIKILLLGSIFPRKIEFDRKNYRTRSYNRMLDVIYQETNRLQGQKNEKSSDFSEDFNCVPGAGVENIKLSKISLNGKMVNFAAKYAELH